MVHDCAYVGYELRRGLVRRNFKVRHLFFNDFPKIGTVKMAIKLRKIKCDLIHAHFCHSAAYASYASGKPAKNKSSRAETPWSSNHSPVSSKNNYEDEDLTERTNKH